MTETEFVLWEALNKEVLENLTGVIKQIPVQSLVEVKAQFQQKSNMQLYLN
ncbi:MAG: hypothetical protein HY738_22195 [Bacteroidia bacterium]|nr:hypothetical protein [Bacteroidia bacterium]